MINLIPPYAQTALLKEYWLRVLAVWMFLLAVGSLVVASLLLPTYVLLRSELATLRDEVAANETGTAEFDAHTAALKLAMSQATILVSQATATPMMTYDDRIIALAGNSVSIESLQFTRLATTTTVMLTGIARDRQTLATYRDLLEAEPAFTDTVLPIASLIKDKDIEFSLTLVALHHHD